MSPGPSKLTVLSLVLASAALVVAIGALWITLARDAATDLTAYELTTPEGAVRGYNQMIIDDDIPAMAAYGLLGYKERSQAIVDTLKVHKIERYKKLELLFTTHVEEEETVYSVMPMRKVHSDELGTDVWVQSYTSEWDVRESDGPLADEMKAWLERNPQPHTEFQF